MASRRDPVIVIGAGPHGLASAVHLRSAGVNTISFGEPLRWWRQHMPKGMMLRSRKRSSNISDPDRSLTIDRYIQAERTTVHEPHLLLEEFIDYGLWFQRRAVPDLDRRTVTRVTDDDGRFAVELEDGETLSAARVVVAAGLSPFEYRPREFAELPKSLVSHSSEHPDLAVFAEQRVVVIGAGQSALESAALLLESGAEVEVLVRSPAVRWLADGAAAGPAAALPTRRRFTPSPPPTDVGGRLTGWIAAMPDLFRCLPRSTQAWVSQRCISPAGSQWLRPRLGRGTISCARSVVRAEPSGEQIRVRLDDGSERIADHVLLGTGYAVDVNRYRFLADDLRAKIELAGGYPKLRSGLESSVPGVHFVGAPAAFTFGPIMRFVVGTWYSAPALTRAVVARRQPPIRFSF